MTEQYKRIKKFMKANDAWSYLVSKKLKAAEKLAKQKQMAKDAEGDKEDSGWRTTENGKHYQINSEGTVVKGPNAMKGGNRFHTGQRCKA